MHKLVFFTSAKNVEIGRNDMVMPLRVLCDAATLKKVDKMSIISAKYRRLSA
jgi:hypothetical protein